MYLQHWKFEIKKDDETGMFCVRDLSINKGRYGGGVAVRNIFKSEKYENCAEYCRKHNIKIDAETR